MHTIYEGRGNNCPASLERSQIGRIADAAHGGALAQHIKALGSFSSVKGRRGAVEGRRNKRIRGNLCMLTLIVPTLVMHVTLSILVLTLL